MSYTKKTWHDGDTITAAALNNLENGCKNNDTAVAAAAPFVVPVTVTEDGETLIPVTAVTFAELKTAILAGRDARAELTLPENAGVLTLRKSAVAGNASDPSQVDFAMVTDMGGSDGASEPTLFVFKMSGKGNEMQVVSLAIQA